MKRKSFAILLAFSLLTSCLLEAKGKTPVLNKKSIRIALGKKYRLKVKNAAGENITGSGYVGTGAVVSAGASSTVIVKGDVNGDGLLSSTDYLRIKRYVGEGEGIDGVFFKAADTDGNGKIQSFRHIKYVFYTIVPRL